MAQEVGWTSFGGRREGSRASLANVEPEPDTKDWTWTLSRRCEQCGLAAGEVSIGEVPERAFVAAEEWVAILRSSPAVAARREPTVWSPLEYGAHVRDVYRLFDERLALMLTEDEPTFANWDQDVTAREQRYAEQDPEVVADELEAAALAFVARVRSLRPDQLDRRGFRSNGSEFTVVTLCQYFLHDVIHHLSYARHFAAKRTAALKAIADQRGWAMTPAAREPGAAFQPFGLFTVGRGRRMSNHLQGELRGAALETFDYQYTTGSGKSTHTVHQTVVALQSPALRLPDFSLSPENLFHKMGAAFGYQDLDFEDSPNFSRRYLVRGKDEAAVRALLNESVRAFFETLEPVTVEGFGDRLLIYRGGRLAKPAQLVEFIEKAGGIYGMFSST